LRWETTEKKPRWGPANAIGTGGKILQWGNLAGALLGAILAELEYGSTFRERTYPGRSVVPDFDAGVQKTTSSSLKAQSHLVSFRRKINESRFGERRGRPFALRPEKWVVNGQLHSTAKVSGLAKVELTGRGERKLRGTLIKGKKSKSVD